MDASAKKESSPLEEIAWRGIELCRQGDWQEGLYWLGQVAEAEASGDEEVPALFYAYLGYGVARYHGRTDQGLALCSRAIAMDRYQPESYCFLARLYLLLDNRRLAFQIVERGLEIDAANPRLYEIRRELGKRRSPVVPFLSRRHPVNRYLGQMRHQLLGSHRPGRGSMSQSANRRPSQRP